MGYLGPSVRLCMIIDDILIESIAAVLKSTRSESIWMLLSCHIVRNLINHDSLNEMMQWLIICVSIMADFINASKGEHLFACTSHMLFYTRELMI